MATHGMNDVKNGMKIIVNGEPTKMDRFADALLIGPLSTLLPTLCGTLPGFT